MSDAPAPPSGSPPPSGAPPAPGQSTPDAKSTAPAAPVAPKKYRVPLEDDGEEKEYTLEELRAFRTRIQKGDGATKLLTKADQRLREANEKEKRAASIGERFKSREEAEKVLAEWGIDPAQFAESLLLPRIQQQMMTDEQRAYMGERQRAEAAEAKLAAIDEQNKQREQDAAVQNWQNTEGQRALNALQKMGLPQEAAPFAVWRVAKYLEREIDRMESDDSYEPMPAEDVAATVLEDYRAEHKQMATAMSGEALVQWLGDDVVKRIRQHDLAQLRARQGRLGQAAAPGIASNPNPSNGSRPKRLDDREWQAELQRRLKGGQ